MLPVGICFCCSFPSRLRRCGGMHSVCLLFNALHLVPRYYSCWNYNWSEDHIIMVQTRWLIRFICKIIPAQRVLTSLPAATHFVMHRASTYTAPHVRPMFVFHCSTALRAGKQSVSLTFILAIVFHYVLQNN